MQKKTTNILKTARKYVFKLFKEQLDSKFVYHNYVHTHETVEAAKLLGEGNKLSKGELEIVQLAAWFHDTGYIQQIVGHEAVSAEIASDFLRAKAYPEEKITQIVGCIMATKMPQQPQNLLEEVLADADLYSLGSQEHFDKTDILRIEMEATRNVVRSKVEWLKDEIAFLSNHRYHTPYAQLTLNKQKTKNVARYTKLLNDAVEKNLKIEQKQQEIAYKKEREQRPDRGIETLFRVSLKNHIALSAIADNKANIMLSINAVIISIIVSTLVPRFDTETELIIPTCMLLFVCVLTIIFATISTIPKVTVRRFTREDIKDRKANLLFFGNFYKMPLPDFEWGFSEMMKDRDYLYNSMTRDFYFLGQVLVKKYRYLRFCYNVFMYGLIASVIAFVIAMTF